jgi:DNA-binding CsgD family transcriptional regulator
VLPAGLEKLVHKAEGVPFLVEELLASAVAAGVLARRRGEWVLDSTWQRAVPHSFADGVRRRTSRLGDHAGAVLQAAAVLGRSFEWTLVGPTSGLSNEVILAVLRRAEEAQLLRRDPTAPGIAFRFRHALTRDAVLAQLLPHELAGLASRALEVLEAHRPGLPGDACEIAIELAGAAGASDRMVDLLLEAASRALTRGALGEAEARLERARGTAHASPGLLISVDEMLLEVLALSGKTDEVVLAADRLLAALEKGEASQARRAGVHLSLARALAAASRWPEARKHADRAQRLADRSAHLVAAIDALAAEVAMGEFRLDEARERAQAALDRAQRLGLPDVACHALETLGRHARTHDLATAERLFSAAVNTADRHGLVVRRLRALHELGTVAMLRTNDLGYLEQASELAVEVGALATAAVVDVQLGSAQVYNLDPNAVSMRARRAADIAGRLGLRLTQAAATALEATAHGIAGRHDAMEQTIGEAFALAGDHPDIALQVWGNARALMFLLNEDRPAALAALDQAMVSVRDPRCTVPGGVVQPLWALLHTLSDGTGTRPREEVRSSRAAALPVGRGLLGYADAVASGRRGARQEAAEAFAAAETLLRPYHGIGVRPLALRLVAETAIQDAWGDPIAWLRETLGYFEGRHAPVASACRELLARTGAKVPRRRPGSTFVPATLRARGVTGREVDVLQLLLEGLTNKQIAERLYLSPKTVEKHVEHLMDKTGIRNRAELAETAIEAGIGPPAHHP